MIVIRALVVQQTPGQPVKKKVQLVGFRGSEYAVRRRVCAGEVVLVYKWLLYSLLAVEFGEQVLVADVGEQFDHFFERLLDGFVGEFFAPALFQQVVAEGGEQLGAGAATDALVTENLERFLQRAMEERVVLERVRDVPEFRVYDLGFRV